jgi:hypothetical protein
MTDRFAALIFSLPAGHFEFKDRILNSKSTQKSNKRAVGTFRQYLKERGKAKKKMKMKILIK